MCLAEYIWLDLAGYFWPDISGQRYPAGCIRPNIYYSAGYVQTDIFGWIHSALVGMELGSGLERSGTVRNTERPEHDASQSGPRTKGQGPRVKDHGPCFGTIEHPRRDTDVILRLSKSTIQDLSFYIGFTRIGSRIKDLIQDLMKDQGSWTLFEHEWES